MQNHIKLKKVVEEVKKNYTIFFTCLHLTCLKVLKTFYLSACFSFYVDDKNLRFGNTMALAVMSLCVY